MVPNLSATPFANLNATHRPVSDRSPSTSGFSTIFETLGRGKRSDQSAKRVISTAETTSPGPTTEPEGGVAGSPESEWDQGGDDLSEAESDTPEADGGPASMHLHNQPPHSEDPSRQGQSADFVQEEWPSEPSSGDPSETVIHAAREMQNVRSPVSATAARTSLSVRGGDALDAEAAQGPLGPISGMSDKRNTTLDSKPSDTAEIELNHERRVGPVVKNGAPTSSGDDLPSSIPAETVAKSSSSRLDGQLSKDERLLAGLSRSAPAGQSGMRNDTTEGMDARRGQRSGDDSFHGSKAQDEGSSSSPKAMAINAPLQGVANSAASATIREDSIVNTASIPLAGVTGGEESLSPTLSQQVSETDFFQAGDAIRRLGLSQSKAVSEDNMQTSFRQAVAKDPIATTPVSDDADLAQNTVSTSLYGRTQSATQAVVTMQSASVHEAKSLDEAKTQKDESRTARQSAKPDLLQTEPSSRQSSETSSKVGRIALAGQAGNGRDSRSETLAVTMESAAAEQRRGRFAKTGKEGVDIGTAQQQPNSATLTDRGLGAARADSVTDREAVQAAPKATKAAMIRMAAADTPTTKNIALFDGASNRSTIGTSSFASTKQAPIVGRQNRLGEIADQADFAALSSNFPESRGTSLSASPAAPPPPARGEYAASVIRQMLEVTGQLQDGPVDLRLNPDELGRVRMHMVTSDQGILMHITSERPETLDLLRRHIDQLHRELSDLGYARVDFTFGQQGRETGSGAPGHPSRTSDQASGDQQQAILAEATPSSPQLGARDRLDIRL